MTPIYCTADQLSKLFRVDYSTMLDILHKDAELDPEIKKLNRYLLSKVVQLHKTTVDPMEIDLATQFVNLYEVQEILNAELGPMVYSTVLRKAAKGEIPALKFGDTYRVPVNALFNRLQNAAISYNRKK
ncbi:DNA-binding protein [Effusibacillus consociatus]|uniref:DNA-binding protein n=1 Tax=Effusibacillus consociatus TaxID=1117041 RepID=A0ABV9Q4N3_9BACL